MAQKEPKPYKPGVLVTSQRAIFVVVVLIGIGAHGALGVWAWDKEIVDTPAFASAANRTD